MRVRSWLAFPIVVVSVFTLPLAACSSGNAPGSPDAGADHRVTDATTTDGAVDAADANADAGKEAGPFTTPPAWNAKVTPPASDNAAEAARKACQFKRGDLPAATVDPSFPLDSANPIQNIVVLMQENRSFDSYFAHLNAFAHRTDINSAPDTTTNPDSMGHPQPYQHAPALCFADTDHSWAGAHREWDNGANDGFFIQNDGNMVDDAGVNLLTGDRSLWWYDQRDIPFYYSLYSTFAISDSYFCSLLGPTWPNRDYLYAGTSLGETTNVFPNLTTEQLTVPSNVVIFDELAQRNVSFSIFRESFTGVSTILGLASGSRWLPLKPLATLTDFFAQAEAGTLPQVSFIDPGLGTEGPDGDDEHPPAQLQVGQDAVYKIVNAVMKSPQWAHTALFITYDENGGEYDHVAPPAACLPDSVAPILSGGDVGTAGTFDRYGFRVPIVVVSPYAKKAFVSHTVYSHTSIIRFIEAKFTLPALTARDANSDPFSDMFDWKSPPFMKPPSFTEPTVDMSALKTCEALYTE
jgi:phospholipase C